MKCIPASTKEMQQQQQKEKKKKEEKKKKTMLWNDVKNIFVGIDNLLTNK